MGSLPVSIYLGTVFDNSIAAIVPENPAHLVAIWCYCSSPEYLKEIRKINQKVQVANSTLTKVHFDLSAWQKIAADKYPNGLPEPESDDPRQWLFHGRPEASEHPLQVAVARLLGYRWPAELEAEGSTSLDDENARFGEENARFNEGNARLDEENARFKETNARLRGENARFKEENARLEERNARFDGENARFKDGNARSNAPEDAKRMRLSQRARALVARCGELSAFVDDDGVVPLVAINTEQPGDQRVRALLEAAYGDEWTPGLLNDLLTTAGSAGKSLEEWLKHDFFAQHCALFHQRPFIWQIWDGKKDGFNILVNYHRLAEGNGQGKKLLEKIVFTYLGDWITQQQAAARDGTAGADTRLKAAQDLQKKLEAILTGEPPFDIFVRWKPLHEQPIGWTPDINDGVRMNIRPFITAGVLRSKVNVKWTKDRGKEPASIRPKKQFPWFWKCPEENPPTDFAGGAEFTGERLNNLHYTVKAKQVARELANDGHTKSGKKGK
jgi:hypothetical protein